MSKCPDKVFCENVFSQVCKYDTAMLWSNCHIERYMSLPVDEVQVPVSLDVNYIAKANQSEEYQYEWYVI